jgi:hypothetical protein
MEAILSSFGEIRAVYEPGAQDFLQDSGGTYLPRITRIARIFFVLFVSFVAGFDTGQRKTSTLRKP